MKEAESEESSAIFNPVNELQDGIPSKIFKLTEHPEVPMVNK